MDDGGERFAWRHEFRHRLWIAFVRQDPEESFAPLSRLLWQVTLYGLCVLAALWVTGLAVARRIARPIGLLQEGVREIGSGRASKPGASMARRLARADEGLYQLTEELT